jgi:hypothetical protein
MDSKIYQFYHNNKSIMRTSALCVVPPKEEILQFLEDFLLFKSETLTLQFGYTIVHHKDNFCKSTGREMAIKNLKEVPFSLSGLYKNKDGFIILELNNESININLEIKKDRKSVYFTQFWLDIF